MKESKPIYFNDPQRLTQLIGANTTVIVAGRRTQVYRGRLGFRKNKSDEKNPETEEDLLQHRTDGTDAFDTLYIGAEKFPQHDTYSISGSGVM